MTTWREAIKPGEAESAGIDREIAWKRLPSSFAAKRRLHADAYEGVSGNLTCIHHAIGPMA
jgi:hypothetical protein